MSNEHPSTSITPGQVTLSDGVPTFASREGPAGDMEPYEFNGAALPIAGHSDDDDADVIASDFLETDQGAADTRETQGIKRTPKTRKVTRYLTKKHVVLGMGAQAANVQTVVQIVPYQPGRQCLHITSNGAGLRIAETPESLSDSLELPKIGTSGEADVYVYAYDGPIYADAPTVAAPSTLLVGTHAEIVTQVAVND